MTNLKNVLEYLKAKYNEVKIFKIEKKHNTTIRIFETKGKRTLYYVAIFDKKNNLLSKVKIISKDKITDKIKEFSKISKEVKNKIRAEKIKINENEIKKYDLKSQTNKIKYKGKKLDDLIFLWGLLRLVLTYADNLKDRFTLTRNKLGYFDIKAATEDKEDKFMTQIYTELTTLFRVMNFVGKTATEKLLDKKFEENYIHGASKIKEANNNKTTYYIDSFLIIYYLQIWNEQVKDKKLKIKVDTEVLYQLVENVYIEYEEKDIKSIENTELLVEEIYHKIYSNYKFFMKLH